MAIAPFSQGLLDQRLRETTAEQRVRFEAALSSPGVVPPVVPVVPHEAVGTQVPVPSGRDGTASGTADLAAVRSFRSADRQVGGWHLYATVTGYLQRAVAPRLFGQAVETEEQPAFVAAAGLTEMAGWMAHDTGCDSAAERHLKRALALASIGQDDQLTAHIYGSLSHLAYHRQRHAAGVAYAQQGQAQLSASRIRHAGLESWLLALQARGHAANRDGDLCLQRLRQAERAIAMASSGLPSPWVSRFDEASLAAEAARCLQALGQPGGACRQAEQVVTLRAVGRVRSRALAQMVLASALIAQGRVDQACGVVRQVAGETRGLGSYLVVQQLDHVRRKLAGYRDPNMAGFLSELGDELEHRRQVAGLMAAQPYPPVAGAT